MRKEFPEENERDTMNGCCKVMGVVTVKMILYVIIVQSSDQIVESLQDDDL